MATQKNYRKQDLLGPKSYPAIVEQIVEKIKNAQAQTLAGTTLLKEVYATLNESITPMMDIKPFVTKAEAIAGDDATLADVVAFCKKSVTTGDLNFIINLCKEEHYTNMNRLNHPDPKSTVKEIEGAFDEPSSVIEKGIKAGLFDKLDSKLLNKIKVDLDVVKSNLNESVKAKFNGSMIRYSPIGIRYEDVANNKTILLLEQNSLSYDRATREFSPLNESVEIAESHRKLMSSVVSCGYNPEDETFRLNEGWDFEMILDSDGQPMLKGLNEGEFKEIPKEKVKSFFIESIAAYKTDPTLVDGKLNENQLLNAADQFIMLMENYDKLIKFDNLETIRNLNEGSYILLDKESVYDTSCPRILGSSVGNKDFATYSEMMESCQQILKGNISDLFESQLINETTLINDRNNKIVSLNESQKELNSNITKLRELKTIAEENSPAMDKLLKQEVLLDTMLNENINDLNFYKNEFKLYQ